MIYDVLIIGAGIEGSAAGYNLVKNEPDKRIVILEQVKALLYMHRVRYDC